MANESDQEKTLPATQKRIDDAREEGRAPRSPELAGALVLMFIAGAVWLGGPLWIAQWRQFVRAGLRLGQREAMDVAVPTLRLAELAWEALLLFAPVAGIAAVAGIGGTLAVGGWLFSPKALEVKFERMNPLAFFERTFSLAGLGELGKTLLKALLIGIAGAWTAWHFRETSAGLALSALPEALNATGHMLLTAFCALVLAMVVIASLDVPFQLWRFHSGLRMSAEEVRREQKESDGNPEIKGRIRQLQREMAKRRMMQEVPKADVIVTNPTHYAVALVYREGKMNAPRIVAKGVDQVAQMIRELGALHKVPVLEAPPLARALYAHGEIDAEIPTELYGVVAQVLAWVFQLQRHNQGEGELPVLPDALEVPAGLDPAAAGATA
jgi:flagellar biosynthetic protein FlhB